MMCRVSRFLLPLYAGGDLMGLLRTWVSRHVDGCESCAAGLETLHQARDRVRILAKEHTPNAPVDFASEIRLVSTHQAPKEIGFAQRYKWALAAAAVVIVTGVGLFQEWQKENVLDKMVVADVSALQEQRIEESFTKGDLEAMMSRLHPDRTLTDAELDAKYPVVEDVKIPNGTQVVYHTDDPNTKIVWVIVQEGAQVQ